LPFLHRTMSWTLPFFSAGFHFAARQAQLRVRLQQLVSGWLLGKRAGALPGSALRSVEEVWHWPSIQEHVRQQRLVYPPQVSTWQYSPELPPSFRRAKAFDACHAYQLHDVCVSAASGMVWFPDAPYILAESVGCTHRLMGWGGQLKELLQPAAPLNLPGPAVAYPGGPFFHWLFEALPQVLLALEQAPEATLLVPAKLPAYAEQALRLYLGEANWDTRVMRTSGPVRVKELWMVSKDPMSGFVAPELLHLLRRTFLPARQPESTLDLYISRCRTPNRSTPGEALLEHALRDYGFQIVYCEELGFAQQVQLFSQARTLLALHGAGLSNMVWATGQLQVLEIFPSGYLNDCYARMARSLDFGYRPFLVPDNNSAATSLPVAAILEWLSRLPPAYGQPEPARLVSEELA
jgi:hypothetical protein